jgi:hypothetical protein
MITTAAVRTAATTAEYGWYSVLPISRFFEDVSKLLELARKESQACLEHPSLPLWYMLHLQAQGFVQEPKMIDIALQASLRSRIASYLHGGGHETCI